EIGVGESARQKQNRVRAERDGKVELSLRNDEILHQDGKAGYSPGAREPLRFPAEVILFRDHRNRRGMSPPVLQRERLHFAVSARRDPPRRRRTTLDLGDDPNTLLPERRDNPRSVRRNERPLFRWRELAAVEPLPLVRENPIEHSRRHAWTPAA